NYFAVLGAKPVAGRAFDTNETNTAVLSYRYWTRRFNRDPGVIGQTLRLNGKPFTVIGVARDGFQGTGVRASEIWVPLHANDNRNAAWLLLGGRLKPGATQAQAAAELRVIGNS